MTSINALYSYYNILNPAAPPLVPGAAPVPAAGADSTTDTPAATAPATTASDVNGVQLSSTVVALLQSLQGDGSNDGLNSLLQNKAEGGIMQQVYASALKSAYAGAEQKANAQSASQTYDKLQSLINGYQAANTAVPNLTDSGTDVSA